MKNKYYYDLHIHSCLSPCADNDNTPANIVGTGVLAGLQIMALTDHNTCKNCPAFFAAAKRHGIVPIAGMELTTAEDIQMICLFSSLDKAMKFDEEVGRHRILIKNRPDIFGEQLILDENDEVIGSEEYLLSNATDISVSDAIPLVESFGGICYPAHIDRESNGIVAVLGAIPPDITVKCVEFHDGSKINQMRDKIPKGARVVISSDAHYLWDIRDKENFVLLDDEPYSSSLVRERLLTFLKEGEI